MLGLIDFSKADAGQQLTRSFRETGFALLENHPISKDLIAAVYADWKEFFESDQKKDYLFDVKTQVGYVPPEIAETAKGYNTKDVKEFYNYREGKRCPPGPLPKTRQLRAELLSLADILLGWVEEWMPPQVRTKLSEPLTSMVKGDGESHLFRPIYYPAFSGSEEPGALRAAAHEDINLITLLATATQPGLQVKDIHGTWHEVNCEPGTLIINSGEMLAIATENYYPATTHQVINPIGAAKSAPRQSMPFFMHPRDEVYLTADKTAGEFLNERLIELGLR